MESLTFWMCIYCAITGTILWITMFFILWSIVHGLKNRYNLSVPMVVIDKLTDQQYSEETKDLILDDKMKSTILEKEQVAEMEGMIV